jgi:transposase-like protein
MSEPKLTPFDIQMIILLNEERNELYEQVKRLSIASLAKKFDVGTTTIKKVLAKHRRNTAA